MSNNVSISANSKVNTIFAGFLGAFILGSLGVQLVRTQYPIFQSKSIKVEPVIAHQSTLWSALGEQDTPIVKTKISNTKKSSGVIPVIGSEATLWAPVSLDN